MAQIDQVEVTQADFTTAVNVLSMVRDGGLNIGPVSAVIARYRIASEEAGFLRGVKAGLEAAVKAVTCNGVGVRDFEQIIADSILALDPQAIAKEVIGE